ncbi:putative 19-kDa protein [Citrus associated ampelovirus 2]|nr:putative 19-kDa protein [Citrus associated ampelovirus 2]
MELCPTELSYTNDDRKGINIKFKTNLCTNIITSEDLKNSDEFEYHVTNLMKIFSPSNLLNARIGTDGNLYELGIDESKFNYIKFRTLLFECVKNNKSGTVVAMGVVKKNYHYYPLLLIKNEEDTYNELINDNALSEEEGRRIVNIIDTVNSEYIKTKDMSLFDKLLLLNYSVNNYL